MTTRLAAQPCSDILSQICNGHVVQLGENDPFAFRCLALGFGTGGRV